MRGMLPYFACSTPVQLPAGELTHCVYEEHDGEVTSILVTPYLPEALADFMLKIRYPINSTGKTAFSSDRYVAKLEPAHIEGHRALIATISDEHSPGTRKCVTFSSFISGGDQLTGIAIGAALYATPAKERMRKRVGQALVREKGYHVNYMLALASAAALQPTHPFWTSVGLSRRSTNSDMLEEVPSSSSRMYRGPL